MSPEEFGRLPDSVHARYQAGLESLRPHIQEFLIRLRTLQGEAGASAQSEYDRRRQRRREHARETLGLVGTVLAHVIEGPPSTKSWAQGARGERRTAARLEKHLAGHPVKLIHDRRIPGYGQANLDHLAVGPDGVTVIDSKTHRGEVRVQRVGGLFTDRHSIRKIGGRDQTRLIDGVERQ
jgi:hypothetical protein